MTESHEWKFLSLRDFRDVKNYGGPNHTPTASHTRHNNSSAITVGAVKNGEHYGEIEPQELHRHNTASLQI